MSVTLRLPYNETFQLGDVVVLGELIVRNIIHTGRVEMNNTGLKCDYHYIQKKQLPNEIV